ncbi:MAG: restriction endonuclease subunit S [Candidatus Symbiothrix sp.]|jgi:hypothetical protein|nr:restriction endonuclease subunit S [Candidatus Symbiothrix sp.]
MKRLDEIFDVRYGSQLDLNKCIICEKPCGYNFVNRSEKNCGVSARILEEENKKPFPAGFITVAMGGSVLSSFVQQEPFYTGQNVKVLKPKKEMSDLIKLYYCYCIEQNRFRFSTFGREANVSFESIIVPDLEELPKDLSHISIFDYDIEKESIISEIYELNTDAWQWFGYDKIFDIRKGKRLTKAGMIEGDINFIGASKFNNGLTAKVGNDEHIHPANTITLSYNGSIGEAFYQPKPFWATDDVNVLYPRFELNPYIALFLCALLPIEKYRFGFGRKWDKEMMQETEIKLPVTSSGTPDWHYMENYIKTLPYSKYI